MRGPLAVTASRRLPGPESSSVLTAITRPPRPPGVSLPNPSAPGNAGSANAPPQNVLTAREKAEGWTLLFDGTSTAGWKGFGKPAFPSHGWTVEDGTLKGLGKKGGDIITTRTFDDFEFAWDWRLSFQGNSGIKYFVDEARGNAGGAIGHEYQTIDDDHYTAMALNEQAQQEPGAVPRPVEWVRIHKLPDFAYFDHRAHVNAGVACQSCHGPIETMERVRQFESLSMGWCVNCHREANATGIQGKAVNASTDCATCHY